MPSAFVVRGIVLVAVLALAVPALAKPITKDVNLSNPAKIGRTQLNSGAYRVVIDGEKITVKQGSRVVAETTGQFVERERKQQHNSVVIGPGGELQEVRFAGDRRVLVLD